MKIPPMEAELFHADGQTDGHDEASLFRNFAKAPKNEKVTLRMRTKCSMDV
jgi:hypothetical protein